MPVSPENIWDQSAQKSFFAALKTKSHREQGESILAKAEELINHGRHLNHDLLKGAESLLNMYTLKHRNKDTAEVVKNLLAKVYTLLGEEEKASRFLK